MRLPGSASATSKCAMIQVPSAVSGAKPSAVAAGDPGLADPGQVQACRAGRGVARLHHQRAVRNDLDLRRRRARVPGEPAGRPQPGAPGPFVHGRAVGLAEHPDQGRAGALRRLVHADLLQRHPELGGTPARRSRPSSEPTTPACALPCAGGGHCYENSRRGTTAASSSTIAGCRACTWTQAAGSAWRVAPRYGTCTRRSSRITTSPCPAGPATQSRPGSPHRGRRLQGLTVDYLTAVCASTGAAGPGWCGAGHRRCSGVQQRHRRLLHHQLSRCDLLPNWPTLNCEASQPALQAVKARWDPATCSTTRSQSCRHPPFVTAETRTARSSTQRLVHDP